MNTVQPIREQWQIDAMKEKLKTKSYRDWFMFVLGISVGYRISDLIGLKVSDIKEKTHITITEEKTGKSSRIKIRESLMKDIAAYVRLKNDNDYLFPSRKGGEPITRVQAYRILKNASSEVGISEVGCHTLRKTFGYHIYQKTKDITVVQKLLNHSSPSITMRYIGLEQDILDSIIDSMEI